MAVKPNEASQGESHGSGRRFAVGLNVVVSIVVAAALLVAVNAIAHMRYIRDDIATIGSVGVSERTKRILAEAPGDIQISVVYAPDAENEQQQKYIDQVMDYCYDLRNYSPKVNVTHVSSGRQREELAVRINKTFGGEADAHKKALADFEAARSQSVEALRNIGAQADALLGQESWISDFPLFAQISLKLKDINRDLDEAAEEIKTLTPADGIPKFAEAAERAKTSATGITQAFEAIGKLLSELTTLADDVTKPDSANIKSLREVASGIQAAIAALRQTIGDTGSPIPADPRGALKAYADKAVETGALLDTLVAKTDAFAAAFPIVKQHANWTTKVQNGPFVMQLEVGDVLQDMGETLRKMRLQLLGIIDANDAEQLKQSLEQARERTGRLEKNVDVCEKILNDLADRLSNLDEPSKKFLEIARGEAMFKTLKDSFDAADAELKALPELKLGSVADKLKEDNSIIIEVNNKLRVVDFASAWPVRETIPGSRDEKEEEVRTFNGDAAISSAILALKADKPFAAVTLVSFEPPAPQQRSPFMPPPPQSSLQAAELTEFKSRLEAANFKIYEWNLAKDKVKPAIDEGLSEILVLLPPAPPAQPNPFQQQQEPQPSFGDAERKIVQDAVAKAGRVLFVGLWDPPQRDMFTGQFQSPAYGYDPVLASDWGLRFDNGTRVVAVDPDQKSEGFTVNVQKFSYMPLTGFLDQPIGSPMIGTRFLATDCAPIDKLEETPKNVKLEPVVEIPDRPSYIGVGIDGLIQIVNQINNPKSAGVVELDKSIAQHGPFNLMYAAIKQSDDGKSQTRMVVTSLGSCIRDRYVKQPVLVDTQRARFAPEPKEALDLFVNTMYWLNSDEGYIGRGPVPVPRVRALTAHEQLVTKTIVWFAWPGVIIAVGGILWFFRR